MTVACFDRPCELVSHGVDLYGRTDTVEFRGRSNQLGTIDWLAEAAVTLQSWGDRRGIGSLLVLENDQWAGVANAMPFDAIYVRGETLAKLVFSEYVAMTPGARYRLFLANAVICKPTITLTVLVRPLTFATGRKGWAKVRAASR